MHSNLCAFFFAVTFSFLYEEQPHLCSPLPFGSQGKKKPPGIVRAGEGNPLHFTVGESQVGGHRQQRQKEKMRVPELEEETAAKKSLTV